jgi:SAM-dependent methyltransferase
MRLSAIHAVDAMIERFGLDATSRIVEVASHGGYLQTFFAERHIPTEILPSDSLLAADRRLGHADLLIDNFLLSHLPDPGAGLRAYADLLAPGGHLVLELDHVLTTIGGRQFDAFRHGHFSYISLTWLTRALEAQGLRIIDAEEFSAYGGALRVVARGTEGSPDPSSSVEAILAREQQLGLDVASTYEAFRADVLAHRWELRDHLEARRSANTVVAGYGAPSRATTLLNFAGVTPDLLPFTADASPDKWGHFIPGARIRIVSPEALLATRPAEILILVWDLHSEVISQLSVAREWDAHFIVPIPRLQVVG